MRPVSPAGPASFLPVSVADPGTDRLGEELQEPAADPLRRAENPVAKPLRQLPRTEPRRHRIVRQQELPEVPARDRAHPDHPAALAERGRNRSQEGPPGAEDARPIL